ncbi:MAG: hypothetical protein FGM27_08365 [Candidatus Omnitrophica bacterium]|nr:hypothetical protein [Candidatus Omnitrophota bacterium]
MKYQVLAVALMAALSLGFSFGSKKEEKNDQADQVRTAASAAVDSSVDSAKRKASGYETSAAPRKAAKLNPSAPSGENFPTELVSQLATGDEASRKARMESLKRLSKALGQMNKNGQPTAAKSSEKSASKKSQAAR